MKFILRCSIVVLLISITIENSYSKNNLKMSEFIKPSYLQKGDTVAIVAPASAIKDSTSIKNGIELLKSWGLNVVYGKHLFDKQNHFAGSDLNRTTDFQEAMDNPNIKAIWCARGGYGTVRIIEGLNFEKFIENPKWIIGYSDVTVLHNHIHSLGIETIHGIMATSSSSIENTDVSNSLKNALFGHKLSYKFHSSEKNRIGEETGILIGGNLSLLAAMLGTPSDLNTSNKIIFIEDIGEQLYRIDRMIMSLKQNDYFKNCNGVIIGGITDIPENDPPFGISVEDIILNAIGNKDIPVIFDFEAGHIKNNFSLILGREISIKSGKKNSKVVFSK